VEILYISGSERGAVLREEVSINGAGPDGAAY
jgi:hypothetical protein